MYQKYFINFFPNYLFYFCYSVGKLVKISSWGSVFSGNSSSRDNYDSNGDDSEDGFDVTSPQNGEGVSLLDSLRSRDVQVLETYGINYIFDLMVEERLLRYGMQ